MHQNSRLLFSNYALQFFEPGMRVLEIGPDAFPSTFRKMVTISEIQWDTLDIYDSPSLTYPNSAPYRFNIPDNSYDLVLSGQVIEHVARIWRWMPEVARVTKPGGHVITINPVSWPYHEAPIDCWRIFPEGMKALCEDAGLQVVQSLFDSLEKPDRPNVLPGRSLGWQPKRSLPLRILHRILKVPFEKAYDAITIARKPEGGTLPAANDSSDSGKPAVATQ